VQSTSTIVHPLTTHAHAHTHGEDVTFPLHLCAIRETPTNSPPPQSGGRRRRAAARPPWCTPSYCWGPCGPAPRRTSVSPSLLFLFLLFLLLLLLLFRNNDRSVPSVSLGFLHGVGLHAGDVTTPRPRGEATPTPHRGSRGRGFGAQRW